MRKQINKIIRKHIRVEGDDIIINHKEAAKEIEEMASVFNLWCIYNVAINYEDRMIEIQSGKEFDSFKELFKYWKDEVQI